MSQAHDGATLPAGEPSHVADRSCHGAEHNDDVTKIQYPAVMPQNIMMMRQRSRYTVAGILEQQ